MISAKDLQRLKERLAARTPATIDRDVEYRAAVAAILRDDGDKLSLLFIRRAEREGDRWSGHMAFPGGMAEPEDASLLHTAIRETKEEIGLDLEKQAILLGRLDDIRAGARRPTKMIAAPFVFFLERDVPLEPNHEVAEVIWTPLLPLVLGEADCVYEYPWEATILKLPGYKVGERIVWGMTHRMLQELFDHLRAIAAASIE